MRAKVMFMNGDRIDGYYYIGIEGTDLRACKNGHPEFSYRFKEGTEDAKRNAQRIANKVNKQLKKITKKG